MLVTNFVLKKILNVINFSSIEMFVCIERVFAEAGEAFASFIALLHA